MKRFLFGEGLTDQALKTYAKQRFDAPRFLPLATYLLFYARPYVLESESGFTVLYLILLVALLFCFRLFDDLCSSEIDAEKPNRIYTDKSSHTLLKNFLIIFSAFIIGVIWIFKKDAALILLLFSAFNLVTYFFLFKTWKWRFILPLLKYPFLCFWLFFKNEQVSQYEILISASLFSAFLLFEIFDDEEFSFKNWITFAIFLTGNLLLLFANPASVSAWIFAGSCIIILPLIVKNPAGFKTILPYAILIYFLILRLLVQL